MLAFTVSADNIIDIDFMHSICNVTGLELDFYAHIINISIAHRLHHELGLSNPVNYRCEDFFLTLQEMKKIDYLLIENNQNQPSSNNRTYQRIKDNREILNEYNYYKDYPQEELQQRIKKDFTSP